MRKLISTLVFVLFLASTMHADECHDDPSTCLRWVNVEAIDPIQWEEPGETGYVEQVTVRVLDEQGRSVTGALVNITWEISGGRGLATTRTLSTGDNGRVQFTLMNVEFAPKDVNRTYIVRAGYGDAYSERPFSAINGIIERTMTLPVYNVRFRARDKNYNPINALSINVDGIYSTKTSKNGIAYLILDAGEHIATPEYRDVMQEVAFEVEEDMDVEIMLRLYELKVRVIDDNANPLIAQVHVGGQTQKSGTNGWANFTNITSTDIIVHSTYGRYKKSIPANLERSDSLIVVFDSTPPRIEDVNVQYQENSIQVRTVVKDTGQYASGLSDENASIDLFYIGQDNIQKTLPMYSIGYGLYEGLIPITPGQNTVRYTIQATDSDGNSASNSDTYVIPVADRTGFGDTQDLPPASAIDEQFKFDWTVLPIVALVGLAAAGAGYWYYNSKKPPSQEEEEEPVPRESQEYSYGGKSQGSTLDTIPKKDDEPPTPPKVPN